VTSAGILLVDKSEGWTSHDVVAVVRRLIGERRVGHAGTLDPAATGVLPLFIGRATRLIQYLHEQDKEYVAQVALGRATDTYDAQGRVTCVRPIPRLSRGRVAEAAARFVGTVEQTPPLFSAVKVHGKRAYALARLGETVALQPRTVVVQEIEVLQVLEGAGEAAIGLRVVCGSGTYIRSLAHDLARELGTAGHLRSLCRMRVGPFRLGQCVAIEELRQREREDLITLLREPDEALLEHRAALLAGEHENAFRHGAPISATVGEESQDVRIYGHEGAFLGTARPLDGMLKPRKMLAGQHAANANPDLP